MCSSRKQYAHYLQNIPDLRQEKNLKYKIFFKAEFLCIKQPCNIRYLPAVLYKSYSYNNLLVGILNLRRSENLRPSPTKSREPCLKPGCPH